MDEIRISGTGNGSIDRRGEGAAGQPVTFVCGPEPADIFCAVYEACALSITGEGVSLKIEEENFQPDFFSRYLRVERDERKASLMARRIRERISEEAWRGAYRASLSWEPGRADAVYRFVLRGFQIGTGVTDWLQDPNVCRVFELSRKVANESHLFLGFTRFVSWDNGVLFGRIAPKCHVLALIAPHFAGRLPGENWMIYDENRKKAAVHPAGGPWYMMDTVESGWEEMICGRKADEGWDELWRTFVKHIAIEPRTNPKLQRDLLPLWYRKNMTEFLQ